MTRIKVDDSVFLELQDQPKGYILPGNYIHRFINYVNKDGGNDCLNFIVSEKLFNQIQINGYYDKFKKLYAPNMTCINDCNFPYDPDEALPLLSLVIQFSIS